MSFDPPSESSAALGFEPLHEVAMVAVNWLCINKGPLFRAQADELVAILRAQRDEDLGDALTSLTRVAGYFHTRLDEPAVAAQLLEVCYEVGPQLDAAAERLKQKSAASAPERARAIKRVTAADPEPTKRARRFGDKPKLSVSDLRPRTKFS